MTYFLISYWDWQARHLRELMAESYQYTADLEDVITFNCGISSHQVRTKDVRRIVRVTITFDHIQYPQTKP